MTSPDEPAFDLDDEALLNSGRTVIRCACGFLAVGDDPWQIRWAFEDHDCHYPRQPRHWSTYVFSFWGAAIALIVGSVICTVLRRA
jgi:hypothetical protein